MICEGNFVYKGIEKRDGGEFENDKGQLIKFDSCYQVTVDEIQDGKAEERKFKFPIKYSSLYEQFKSLKLYQSVIISFDVELYKTNVKLVPTDVVCEQEEDDE